LKHEDYIVLHNVMLIRRFPVLLIAFLFFRLTLGPATAAPDNGQPAGFAEIMSLLDNGGFAVMKQGRIIAEYNLHTQFIPASIAKVATSLAALQVLGSHYRFETYFFIDDQQNLYIKGFGDPYLISEEVERIVKTLRRRGCTRIDNIYLDNSSFDIPDQADGAGGSDNPYDARNSGLAVNFNTVNVTKDAAGRIFSAEKQTPTLPLMLELAKDLESGTHRINITMEGVGGPEIISRYVGELFRAFLQKENIPVQGNIAVKKTPETISLYYRHKSSRSLTDIIPSLMRYSNNFIANQLYLAVGAEQYGYPATWEKSRKAIADIMFRDFHLPPDSIALFEGSGLSRNNRISPFAMLKLLDLFKPYSGYLPVEKERSVKSGTLKGVYSYCGYFHDNGGLDSFVLILNQKRNTRKQLLDELERMYKSSVISE
jgi:D-alanyl-D-alanine carboxypeptidase/D-alanyl-D-alanine-endopeptidase (penicillin-binding protein 4)